MNNVSLLGRLTATPELKKSQSDVPYTQFCLAVERWNKEVDWIDCVAYNKTAEFIDRYFTKGNRIAVVGTLQTRNYEDKEHNKRKATTVVVNNVYFCESKDSQSTREHSSKDNQDDDWRVIQSDEDLPF